MIAVDWGTSSLRAYLTDAAGAVVDRRASTDGILAAAPRGFAEVLFETVGDWLPRDTGDVWLSGMIGSRQGWLEVPYVGCPAGAAEIRAGVGEIAWQGRRVRIAPGVISRDEAGAPDVMRGEEVQILGILAAVGDAPATVVLPGTHSKWVRVAGGRILSFRTHMTGEAFALFREHSILSRLMPEKPDPRDEAAFAAGVSRARTPGGLLSHLFAVRARGLMGELGREAGPSYLSGILVGHEIAAALESAPAGPVHIVGSPALAASYAAALTAFGREAVVHDSDAALAGLVALAGL